MQTPLGPTLGASGSSGDLSKHTADSRQNVKSADEEGGRSLSEEADQVPAKVDEWVSSDDVPPRPAIDEAVVVEEAEALGCISDFLDSDVVESALGSATSKRKRRRPFDDDARQAFNVVTESSDSSDSASVHGKSERPRLQHGSASAPLLGRAGQRSAKPLTQPSALRRRASMQVLPERVEYHCASCGEVYTARSSTVYNPWWSLVRQSCPKCDQSQFPWIDISSATNQITHHLGTEITETHDDDDNDVNTSDDNNGREATSVQIPKALSSLAQNEDTVDDPPVDVESTPEQDDDDAEALLLLERREDEEDDEAKRLLVMEAVNTLELGVINNDIGIEDAVNASMASPTKAVFEDCAFADESSNQADRLSRRQAEAVLHLFQHARDCPGRHCSRRHHHVCTATKFIMLHARDCRGTLPCGRACPFVWCVAIKRFLSHLVKCTDEAACEVCRADAQRTVRAMPRPTLRNRSIVFNAASSDRSRTGGDAVPTGSNVSHNGNLPLHNVPPPAPSLDGSRPPLPRIIISKPHTPRPVVYTETARKAEPGGACKRRVATLSDDLQSEDILSPQKLRRTSFDFWDTLNSNMEKSTGESIDQNQNLDALAVCPDEHRAIIG